MITFPVPVPALPTQRAPVTLDLPFRVIVPLPAEVPNAFADRATRPFSERLSFRVMFAKPEADAGMLTVYS